MLSLTWPRLSIHLRRLKDETNVPISLLTSFLSFSATIIMSFENMEGLLGEPGRVCTAMTSANHLNLLNLARPPNLVHCRLHRIAFQCPSEPESLESFHQDSGPG